MLERLAVLRVVPIVVLDDSRAAAPLADALVDGGLACAEVTLLTSAGLATIAAMSSRSDILVGAGTILTPHQVDEVVDAGTQFIVSPGFALDVVNRARERRVLVLPGTVTASELQAALGEGLEAVKIFPAEVLGGVPLISALAGPLATVSPRV